MCIDENAKVSNEPNTYEYGKKEWIHRQRSQKDKRQILIALREEKIRAYQEQHEHILNIVNKLVERIGRENAEKTVELFNLIEQIAREEII